MNKKKLLLKRNFSDLIVVIQQNLWSMYLNIRNYSHLVSEKKKAKVTDFHFLLENFNFTLISYII
jgi:hypothetical protein